MKPGHQPIFSHGRHAAEPSKVLADIDESRLQLAALVDLAAAGFAAVPLDRIKKAS